MLRVTKPPARVNLWRGRRINDALLRYVREPRFAEQSAPFFGSEKMCMHREKTSPLMAMRIVTVVVDQHAHRAAFAENAKNIFDARSGIGPVIRRFDRNHMGEKIRLQGNLRNFSRDEHHV